MRSARRLAALALGVALVSGCGAGGSDDLAPEAADDLQAAVLDVSRAAAQGRYDAALRGVEQVRTELTEAAEGGHVSVARYAAIDDALRRVEAELRAAADGVPGTLDDATTTPTATPTATATPTRSTGSGTTTSGSGAVDREGADSDGTSADDPKKGPGSGGSKDGGKGEGKGKGKGRG